jgi:mono/diheme cytochrome c family protein
MRFGVWALVIVTGLWASVARAETQLERGAYLVRGIMACGNCHTPKGPGGVPVAGREMAGGFVIEVPEFRVTVPNITPDRETGIGGWSDDEIINAIRNGRRPDGRLMGPPMSFEFYRKMSDADVRAVVAFLRRLPPVVNKIDTPPL